MTIFLERREDDFLHKLLRERLDQDGDSLLRRVLIVKQAILFIVDGDVSPVLDLIRQRQRLHEYVSEPAETVLVHGVHLEKVAHRKVQVRRSVGHRSILFPGFLQEQVRRADLLQVASNDLGCFLRFTEGVDKLLI